jgi:uncharacterized protein (DUF2236 family)
MVETRLQHTTAVDEVLAALARPPAPALAVLRGPGWAALRPPLGHLLSLATVGLLPAQLRRRFGLSWSRSDEAQLRVLAAGLRAMTPLMPPPLRNAGPVYLRWRREALARGEVTAGR